LRTGSARFNEAVAGVISRPNNVKSTKNGCCTLSDRVDTDNVDGDNAIVRSKSRGLRETAAHVVAICLNKSAFTDATGATAPINEFKPSKNRVNPVPGADKYRATGSKCPNNAGKLAIVSFNADPRPANTFP
jgi:hypothetical protein